MNWLLQITAFLLGGSFAAAQAAPEVEPPGQVRFAEALAFEHLRGSRERAKIGEALEGAATAIVAAPSFDIGVRFRGRLVPALDLELDPMLTLAALFATGNMPDLEFPATGESEPPPGDTSNDEEDPGPRLVPSLSLAEGPFAPREADLALGGAVARGFAGEAPMLGLPGEYGPFDAWRSFLLDGPGAAGAGSFARFDRREGNRFGPHRPHETTSAIARHEHRSGDLRWAVLGATHSVEFESADIVREDDFEGGRLPCEPADDAHYFCAAAPSQRGLGARHALAGTVEWSDGDAALTQEAWVASGRARFREDFGAAWADPSGDGGAERHETRTIGLRGSVRFQGELGERAQELELGYLGRTETGATNLARLRSLDSGPSEIVSEEDLSIGHVAAYARGELAPSERLRVTAGVRLDSFQFSIDRPQAVGTFRTTGDRGAGFAVSPHGSVRLDVAEGLAWLTTVGFGTRSSDAIALRQGASGIFADVFASETGLVYDVDREDVSIEAQALAYHSRISHDLLVDDDTGENAAVGPSHRFGVLAAARLQYAGTVDLRGSFLWTEAHATNDGSLFDLTGGSPLPFVPRFVARLDASVERAIAIGGETIELGGALGVMWIGPKPMSLEGESPPIVELDAGISAGWRSLELGFSIDNVLGVENPGSEFHYASDFDATGSATRDVEHLSAGEPRSFYVTLSLRPDGE